MFKKSILTTSVLLTLSACGGSSSSDTNEISSALTATGQFKDSNTAGIQYVSGEQSGITSSDGFFTYEIGETVTFSVGGVTLGTSNGKSVVTPVDLVAEGNTNAVEVQNIVRLLMMLDSDGDASNGINVSADVLSIAEDWSQIDFTTTNLSADLTDIISDAISADGGEHILPEGSAAQEHLEETLLCSYAGAYMGKYTGNDNGNFGFLIDASNGDVTGVAYSTQENEYAIFNGTSPGTSPISYDQNVSFVSGNASTGAFFDGQFTSVNSVIGTWVNNYYSTEGDFSGERVGGSATAKYRFTGSYDGDGLGLFAFDISDSNNVTGVAYSAVYDELLTVTGSLSGTSLSASASDGTLISGSLNTDTGELNGSWSYTAENLSGTFSGSGCQLN